MGPGQDIADTLLGMAVRRWRGGLFIVPAAFFRVSSVSD